MKINRTFLLFFFRLLGPTPVQKTILDRVKIPGLSTGGCYTNCNGGCGYNWYKRNYNNGNPTWYYSRYCECCGGNKENQDECKKVCSTKVSLEYCSRIIHTRFKILTMKLNIHMHFVKYVLALDGW